MFVRSQQRHLMRDGFFDKPIKGRPVCPLNALGDHVAFPADSSDHRHFVAGLTACVMGLFVPVAVFVLTANVSFVYFNLAKKLLKILSFIAARMRSHIYQAVS